MLAAATLAAAALGTAACSGGSGSGPIAPLTMSSGSGNQALAGVTDIQILNSLEMTSDALNAAFGSDQAWHEWSPTTNNKDDIGYTGFLKCKGGLDSTGAALSPAVTTFSADTLPSDSSTPTDGATTAPSKSKSSTKKKGSPSSSSSTSSSSSSSANGDLPKHWVISIAAVYKTAAAAKTAAMAVGKMDTSSTSVCGQPSDGSAASLPQFIGGQIGETEPTWYGEDPTVGFVVTKTNYAMTAVAQQRGRFVVVTVTGGNASLKNGYYSLNSIPDTDTAAEAATSLLGQLTNAVVNGS